MSASLPLQRCSVVAVSFTARACTPSALLTVSTPRCHMSSLTRSPCNSSSRSMLVTYQSGSGACVSMSSEILSTRSSLVEKSAELRSPSIVVTTSFTLSLSAMLNMRSRAWLRITTSASRVAADTMCMCGRIASAISGLAVSVASAWSVRYLMLGSLDCRKRPSAPNALVMRRRSLPSSSASDTASNMMEYIALALLGLELSPW
mmetsp:Transcript_38295/g.113543  ORF Transcript_38295/g.113543 Transcript_38295/m.113543 type:complete len:204 (-) Transcript_38295:1080-1691(-)